jgi:antitoxin (DNA-binding transcriptional repressor) of toxin-antitoxin stability system
MSLIGAREAKTNFSSIINKVINGENVTVTLRGVPVVDMRRHNEQENDDAETAIAEIMELRKEFSGAFKKEKVKALIEEGRM